jgi:hypothetical protein
VRILLILVFLAAGRISRPSGETTVTGWVSDESCGAEHVKPGGEDCVKKCIKGAVELNPEWTPQKMVFVTDGEHEIWVVENPDRLKGNEGKHVRITGTLDREKKSLRVRSSSNAPVP